jgi:hypothetical protein
VDGRHAMGYEAKEISLKLLCTHFSAEVKKKKKNEYCASDILEASVNFLLPHPSKTHI